MSVTKIEGVVENGRIRIVRNVHLHEHAKVFVTMPDAELNSGTAKFDLAEMISRMPPDYRAGEEDWGEPLGKEEW